MRFKTPSHLSATDLVFAAPKRQQPSKVDVQPQNPLEKATSVKPAPSAPAKKLKRPYRWPTIHADISLCLEVLGRRPSFYRKPEEWDVIATALNPTLIQRDISCELTGRACREHTELLLKKYKDQDAKSLRKSGTEEDYGELSQLLQDISSFHQDLQVTVDSKKQKRASAELDKQRGEDMRKAAMESISKRRKAIAVEDLTIPDPPTDDDDEDYKPEPKQEPLNVEKKGKQRMSKKSAVEFLAVKHEQKIRFKERELNFKKQELEFQKKKYEEEAEYRKEIRSLELQEKRAFLKLVNDKNKEA